MSDRQGKARGHQRVDEVSLGWGATLASGFEQLGAIPRRDFFDLLKKALHLLPARLGSKLGPGLDRLANGQKELFLARRRAHAKHSRRLARDIAEEVRSVGRDVHRRAGFDR